MKKIIIRFIAAFLVYATFCLLFFGCSFTQSKVDSQEAQLIKLTLALSVHTMESSNKTLYLAYDMFSMARKRDSDDLPTQFSDMNDWYFKTIDCIESCVYYYRDNSDYFDSKIRDIINELAAIHDDTLADAKSTSSIDSIARVSYRLYESLSSWCSKYLKYFDLPFD